VFLNSPITIPSKYWEHDYYTFVQIEKEQTRYKQILIIKGEKQHQVCHHHRCHLHPLLKILNWKMPHLHPLPLLLPLLLPLPLLNPINEVSPEIISISPRAFTMQTDIHISYETKVTTIFLPQKI
jgi:hypothetical protein